MIGITNAGGGSGRIWMCTVYGGTDPPPKARPGDIFIRTTVPLTKGEITPNVLSKPSWGSDTEGYFYVGFSQGGRHVATNKSLNQTIYGGLVHVWQSINGQWRSMDAYVLEDNNTWTQISSTYNGELFYQGNQYTEHTGGWTGMVRNPDISTNVADPANPNLFSDANAVEGGTAWFRTVNKVDMSSYRTLKWTGWGFGENSGGKYGAHCTVHDNPSPDSGIISDVSFQNEGTYSMDISGISGAHYITFRAMGSGAQRVSISKVWME